MSTRLSNMNPLLFAVEPPDLSRIREDLDPTVSDPVDADESNFFKS